jgi:regulator of protease activity HflC (stomatin/prohibitin superfamily)
MLRYYKGSPTEYVVKFVNGRIIREGKGISFFYWPNRTTVISVPLNTVDVDFVFNEITGNFQAITVQGQVTLRITDPLKISALLDYSIYPRTRVSMSKDPQKLSIRLINLVQEATRAEIQRLDLEDILRKGAELSQSILGVMKKSSEVANLGVEVMNVFLTSIKPTPEVSKALEADYREVLLKKADQAIYDRRAVAVEQERKIQENELETDIALEKERENLVSLKAANLVKEAEAEGKAAEVKLAPYAKMDARTLTALGLKAIGENADKIGTLTITPDLLRELLKTGA